MTDETSRTSPNSSLFEKLLHLAAPASNEADCPEAERPAVWSNATEMFASEFA